MAKFSFWEGRGHLAQSWAVVSPRKSSRSSVGDKAFTASSQAGCTFKESYLHVLLLLLHCTLQSQSSYLHRIFFSFSDNAIDRSYCLMNTYHGARTLVLYTIQDILHDSLEYPNPLPRRHCYFTFNFIAESLRT